LTLQANSGLADGRINNFNGTNLYVGNRSPDAYEWTGDASAEYRFPLNRIYDGMVRLEYQERGNIQWDIQNQNGSDPSGQLNGRIGVQNGKKWNISVFCQNITNSRFPVLFQSNAAGEGEEGELLNEPRFFGVELRGQY
jgi:iron complex outermembrane receptor protein